jgi:hypothetical protein
MERLVTYLRHWKVSAIVVDATGVGQGIADALMQTFSPRKVIPFNFAQKYNKARLGNDFLAIVETGRFKYFNTDLDCEGSDAWWFFTQCERCGYELGEGMPLEKGLKWQVSPTTTVLLQGQPTLVHDDRLLSAALIAEADRLYQNGQLIFSTGQSVVIPRDILAEIDQAEW